jgi:hypothetical protein
MLKTQRTWVFSPQDIIAPWLVGLGCAGICIYGFFYGVPLGKDIVGAKVTMGVTALAFLASIPLWYFMRSRLRKYHYKTQHGIYVRKGKKNNPAQVEVEFWTREVLDHWMKAEFRSVRGGTRKLTEKELFDALEGVNLFYVDKEKLSVLGRWVRGYSWGKDIVVGFRPNDKNYVRSLTIHEQSHPVLGFNGEGWSEQHHHDIFKETALGA